MSVAAVRLLLIFLHPHVTWCCSGCVTNTPCTLHSSVQVGKGSNIGLARHDHPLGSNVALISAQGSHLVANARLNCCRDCAPFPLIALAQGHVEGGPKDRLHLLHHTLQVFEQAHSFLIISSSASPTSIPSGFLVSHLCTVMMHRIKV